MAFEQNKAKLRAYKEIFTHEQINKANTSIGTLYK